MHILLIHPQLKTGWRIQKNLRYDNIGSDLVTHPQTALNRLFTGHYQAAIIYEIFGGFKAADLAEQINKLKPELKIAIIGNKKPPPSITKNTDYLAKLSLVKAWTNNLKQISRPSKLDNRSNELEYKDLKLNRQTRVLKHLNRRLDLKNKEFCLVEFFMLNPKIPLTRNTILENVWDRNADLLTNTIDVHISRLRKKLDPNSPHKLIKTVPCVGYMLE